MADNSGGLKDIDLLSIIIVLEDDGTTLVTKDIDCFTLPGSSDNVALD